MAQPKYQLLQQWLRDQINSGEYTANQQIPTELELAEQFGRRSAAWSRRDC